MLRTKFYLTDGTATGETALYAACYLDGKRKKIYLPTLTVVPKQWNSKKQIFLSAYANHSDANRLLNQIKERLETTYFDLITKGRTVTLDDLRETVGKLLGSTPVIKSMTMLERLDSWIEDSKRDRAANTVRGYMTLRKHLLDYAKARRVTLDFAALDNPFCEAFKTYLLRTANLSNTSINNHVKNLKVFLGAMLEQGHHEQQHFRRFKKMESFDPEQVYLTVAEKRAIGALNLSFTPRLEQTRDIFLFECETGLRFSDVKALRPDQVYKDHLILTTQKTADLLKIPLSPLAKGILDKYKGLIGQALPVKTNQKTNADLKQIARLAKLTQPTTKTHLRGKERDAQTMPKWALVSTHTARRTFITLALEGGMRPEVVMRITGHKNHKTLQPYIKITENVVQDEFAAYINKQKP